MAKTALLKFYHDSHRDCRKSVIDLVEPNKEAHYMDCGCDDGSYSKEVAKYIQPAAIYGIEINKEAAKKATKKGVKVVASDLNKAFSFPDNSLDAVTANQVIEHLYDTDNFVEEIHRILKPGGYAVVSTNNLASWHNWAALLVGKQPFPADVSNNTQIGKLLPLFHGDGGSWAHLRIFTYASLRDIFTHHGFIVEKIEGVSYYPFPSAIARWLAKIDKRHAAYLTVKVRKKAP